MSPDATFENPEWVNAFSGPPELGQRFDNGENLLVLSRNSGIGRKADHDAVDDLYGALACLVRIGIDLYHLVPTKERLMTLLAAAKFQTSETDDGKALRHKHIVIEPPGQQVCFIIIVGSGRKLDDDQIQPAIALAAAQVRRLNPALLYSKRIDRIGRHAWAMGPLMLALAKCGGWVGDTICGLLSQDLAGDFSIFFSTRSGQMAADVMIPATRGGMKNATGSEMIDGRVRFGCGGLSPAGTTTLRLRDGAGAGKQIMVLDGPQWLPHKDEVAYGLPEIFNAAGEHVDQVANIRFALSRLHLPGWPATRIVSELVERQYSTAGLRNRHGPSACIKQYSKHNDDAKNITTRIESNLEFYKTGIFRRSMGIADMEDIVITGCFPPDGFWATDEDFARIEEWRRSGKSEREVFVRQTFAGFPIKARGRAGILLRAPKTTSDERGYNVVEADSYGYRSNTKRVPNAKIPSHAMADLVKSLIVSAGESAVQLIPFDAELDGRLLALRQGLRFATDELAAFQSEAADIENHVGDVGSDGTLALRGALLTRMSEKYDALVEEAIPAARRKVDILDQQKNEYVARLRNGRKSFQLDEVMRVVRSLSDPEDRTYRAIFKESLSDLEFESVRIMRGGLNGRKCRLSGALTIGVGKDSIRLEGCHEWEDGAVNGIPDRAAAIVEQLQAGICYDDITDRRKVRLHDEIAEQLGIDRLHLDSIFLCREPRIFKVAFACAVTMVGESASDVAEAVGQPLELVLRVLSIYGRDARPIEKWNIRGSRILAQMLWACSQNDGLVRFTDIVPLVTYSHNSLRCAIRGNFERPLFDVLVRVGFRLVGRCECTDGVPEFGTFGLKEPAGPVCLRCRRDRMGIEWPSDPYDQYLIQPIKEASSL